MYIFISLFIEIGFVQLMSAVRPFSSPPGIMYQPIRYYNLINQLLSYYICLYQSSYVYIYPHIFYQSHYLSSSTYLFISIHIYIVYQ